MGEQIINFDDDDISLLEKENILLRQNVESLNRRNRDLEAINNGFMKVTKQQREFQNKLSRETQVLSGAITGKHNKKI
ncbi:hypothetical protein GC101_34195 [Paenibacillus sp. LMG 31459]|uniref:Uncharacterized protein n=1 Tax=Paenibacillus phytohabitans TaxID=2654978 RepID=A0ABX1YS48_9BACL|nr:hypothetical protein [Paenibacillus phytohabitans]NOU83908.1 hypothetical protein [Paenibacillus phytohabitans]